MTAMSGLPKETIDPATAGDHQLREVIARLVNHQDYPCLGARSVFHRDRATVRVYDELADPALASRLLADLRSFASGTDPAAGFASFVAVFRGPVIDDELHFEQLLWSQLRQLHEVDDEAWNESVSADPAATHFAFSAAGTAYFIVGLHPRASRLARRIPMPTLVFNLHEQFELLRQSGKFSQMRDKIRQRDEQLQGSTNPMVSDYGSQSEAAQYSGRRVGPDWEAPFHAGRHGRSQTGSQDEGQGDMQPGTQEGTL
jgi:FPC/CPF motif-containing protein YcgG